MAIPINPDLLYPVGGPLEPLGPGCYLRAEGGRDDRGTREAHEP